MLNCVLCCVLCCAVLCAVSHCAVFASSQVLGVLGGCAAHSRPTAASAGLVVVLVLTLCFLSAVCCAVLCCVLCSAAFASSQVLGVQEDVQLREQDFGNFQGEGVGCCFVCQPEHVEWK
jgi:hypothetical protein